MECLPNEMQRIFHRGEVCSSGMANFIQQYRLKMSQWHLVIFSFFVQFSARIQHDNGKNLRCPESLETWKYPL